KAYAASKGYGLIVWNTSTSDNPIMSFIDDEPDAEEATVEGNFCGTGLKIPCGSGHTNGILGKRFVALGESYRSTYPNAPTTSNRDGNLKPDNYYSYGQLADVLQVDPYYQARLTDAYWYNNNLIPLYQKATYNYAVAQAVTTAAEPNSSHVILYSVE